MPSVSSARRSAVDSVDMRAENKSQLGQTSKDKEVVAYSYAKIETEGRRNLENGGGIQI